MAENLASKYRPKTLDDITEQGVVVDILKNICKSGEISNRNFLFIGSQGVGKAQPLDSLVLTTSGYTKMGNIQIGDKVFTASGNIGSVSGIYPQGVRPIYRVTLQDGSFIDVSDEHLNVFHTYNYDTKTIKEYCMTTTEMIKMFKSTKSKMRMTLPQVDWPHKDTPIDPYKLGQLIGNIGNSKKLTALQEEILTEYAECSSKGSESEEKSSSARAKYLISFNGTIYEGLNAVSKALVDEGYPKFATKTVLALAQGKGSKTIEKYPSLKGRITLVAEKAACLETESSDVSVENNSVSVIINTIKDRIPTIYLMNSKEMRELLLQGIFDTKGYIAKDGSCEIVLPILETGQISEDFAFLVRSLGIRDTIWVDTARNTHTHHLAAPSNVKILRNHKNSDRCIPKKFEPTRNIVSIEYLEDKECQCIMIDHPDHTYISDYFVPTHNTTSARAIANELNEGKGGIIEMDAASHSGANDMRQIVEQAQTYPVGTNYKIFIIDECHSISSQGWQVLLKTLEEQPAKSLVMLCTTNAEKIPATILSRVQTFQLSKISLEGIYNRLLFIIDNENKEGAGITYEKDAILFIAKMASGGMRDSITLLEKALAYNKHITTESIQEALGLPHYNDYFDLLAAIAKKDNSKIVNIVNSVYNSGVNFTKWFDGFFSFVTNIVKYIYLKDIGQTMIPSTYQDRIKNYTTAHAALCLKLSNTLVELNNALKTSQYQQELAISYLCTPPTKKKQ